jgi:F-type H+-transporting ATPase subunit epsilon
MMESPRLTLQVEISDVSRMVFSGTCTKLVAPAAYGELCILPRHAPLLTELRPGEIRLQTDFGEDQFFFVSGGYLEVKDSVATVLADQMLRSNEIDREAALAARKEAELALRTSGKLLGDSDPLRLNLIKALAQLRVWEHAELQRLKLHR